ncbi:potassium-transporting ATPase subunit KdpA [Sanguibacter sp. HDW7]|uniref:potassium-transporting ATPase subunit KdpA n=1 Tax=Sanguibacter sp. HDW7 TaxID=2714931 RepID=UPI0014083F79|nr:potassium-transporting ATPase subunit KdpA [Sanguibacter sp. HDW7]QIK83777.1 potassium-transporting ATPase subunit KdpA [Sanguibacter sp. HDW7]
MTTTSVLLAVGQALLLVGALAAVHVPLGTYLARTYTADGHTRVERGIYRLLRVDPDAEMRWAAYLRGVLALTLVSIFAVMLLARTQDRLPLADGVPAMSSHTAWNTAVSFATNTNWQSYAGETAASPVLQAVGLAVQNFVSAAVGIVVAVALVRGFARAGTDGRIGSLWRDLTRTVVRVLLPVAAVAALVLVAGGVVQNLGSPAEVSTLAGGTQTIVGGPIASQEAIKMLGTNGGGYLNANSAHPFENPTPWTNLLEMFLILVIPTALPRAFGLMVGDRRQGRAILATMVTLLVGSATLLTWAELAGPGAVPAAAGAALEGKEVRLGQAASALFAAVTTGTSTGAVNAAHDSLTAPGGGVAMFTMLLGEVAPGGVGSGLAGMLVLAVLTVFLAGLMVGRTPEYLGKRIGRHEMTLVAGYVLTMPALVLLGSATAVLVPTADAAAGDPGAHGLSRIVYAFASGANNNGSAFGGLAAASPFYDTAIGIAMLLGRLVPIVLLLALAGRLASASSVPVSAGTLPTHGPLFVGLLTSVTLVVVGLTFIPVLTLGPILESLS